jgi:uncharacterized protein YndB with AHSA1/START domain/DNA-binding transcriptional ArsR family regulator
MVEQNRDDQLSEVLKAASDPTRRSILTTLVQEGPTRVTDLAAYFDMSFNAVSKHIKVLEAAGLVHRQTTGRTHFISVNMVPVNLIDGWFSQLRSTWELRLEKLDATLMEMDDMQDLMLKVSRRIEAPAQKVFNAWLEPAMLAKFMTVGADISVPEATIDPRVGGRFSFDVLSGEKVSPHGGEYKVIKPFSQIVFSWESPFSVEGSEVTLNFSEAGPSATDVELIHIKFSSEGSRDGHKNVWTKILDGVADILA